MLPESNLYLWSCLQQLTDEEQNVCVNEEESTCVYLQCFFFFVSFTCIANVWVLLFFVFRLFSLLWGYEQEYIVHTLIFKNLGLQYSKNGDIMKYYYYLE